MNIIDQFNEYALDLTRQLSLVCPESIISKNLDNVSAIIKISPKIPISAFIIYILPDKEKIDREDDDYFVNKSYDNVIGNDNMLIKKVFEFKDIWAKLNPNNKKVVIQYMKLLCGLALEYYTKHVDTAKS